MGGRLTVEVIVEEEGVGEGREGEPVESGMSARMEATGMGSCQAVLSTCMA
jgi:hypothetical protein